MQRPPELGIVLTKLKKKWGGAASILDERVFNVVPHHTRVGINLELDTIPLKLTALGPEQSTRLSFNIGSVPIASAIGVQLAAW